jgi:thiol-disulfide isomerase/thioredoxin
MTRAFACSLVALLVACTKDEVRSPAAATSTAAPTAEPTPTPTAKPEPDVVPAEHGGGGHEETPPAARPPLSAVTLAPENGELGELLATAASRARADGLVPIVEMGATWCPPCKKIDALVDDAGFAASLAGIVLVRLDSDAWGEDLDAAGFDAKTIPTFYVVDARGRPTGPPVSGHKWGKLDADGIAARLQALRDR